MQTECSGIVGEGTRVCRFKSVPTSVIADRLTHARQTRFQPEYTVLFSMFSGEFCLRLKPYLVVRIASDVLTEHCCQVCVLAMMFAAPTAGCMLTCVVSDCAIRKHLVQSGTILRSSVPRVLACWHSDRPTWDMKNILNIWFSHFTLTETHRCENYSLSLYFNKKRFSVLTAHAGFAIRQPCSITREFVVNRQQKLSNSSSHTQ